MKIVIAAFNVGLSGSFSNGPGNTLMNLLNFMARFKSDVQITLYTSMNTTSKIEGIDNVRSISDVASLSSDIMSCDILHCWSGQLNSFSHIIRMANKLNKCVILGPNLLDATDEVAESRFLKDLSYNKVLTLNDSIKFNMQRMLRIPVSKIDVFKVGPDPLLWNPPDEYADYILWKGNPNHAVKDIQFAKNVEKKLGKYKFLILGEKGPYDYSKHISIAKKAYLYFSTSISETMGLALLEQWACGVPSVTHPKIFMHGENYKTGIITNRDVASYCDAIVQIMDNQSLREHMSVGSTNFIKESFDPQTIVAQYMDLCKNAS